MERIRYLGVAALALAWIPLNTMTMVGALINVLYRIHPRKEPA
jgi:hypothetical protein